MSWLKDNLEVVIIILCGAIAMICLLGLFNYVDREQREFCELHNLEHKYLSQAICFEVKGNTIIEYPIRKLEGRYYFVEDFQINQ